MSSAVLAGCGTARAATDSATAQQSSQEASAAAVDSISTQIAVFRNAAEQWISANVVSGWNKDNSVAANSFGTYPPILLYVGPNKALCGAPSSTATTVDLVAAGFITANYTPPYSGEYCAMVYPNTGTGTQSGPVGSQGGTDLVSVSTVLAYFVAGANQDVEGALQNSSSNYVVSHIGSLLANNFASGGSVEKFTPITSNSGTNPAAWQSVQP